MLRTILRHPLTYNLLIVLAAFIAYKLLKSGILYPFSRKFIDVVIVAFCVLQIFYFVVFSLRKLFHDTSMNLSHIEVQGKILITIIFVLFTFTMNYWCIFDNEPSALAGINDSSLFRELLDMFYFSCVTFATVGYGDILPKSIAAKSCVILEMASAFFIVVYVLSNVSNIMSAMNVRKEKE